MYYILALQTFLVLDPDKGAQLGSKPLLDRILPWGDSSWKTVVVIDSVLNGITVGHSAELMLMLEIQILNSEAVFHGQAQTELFILTNG